MLHILPCQPNSPESFTLINHLFPLMIIIWKFLVYSRKNFLQVKWKNQYFSFKGNKYNIFGLCMKEGRP